MKLDSGWALWGEVLVAIAVIVFFFIMGIM